MSKYIAGLFLAILYVWSTCSVTSSTEHTPDEDPLNKLLPILLGQPDGDANGTASQFKEYALKDHSNDEIATSTTQEIIIRSGFDFQNHYVLSDDGYITQLIRIINPLASRVHLRWPPVMLMHGGITDPTSYIFASAIQHFPEPWPRKPEDGPITSWNRSLAFTLANNGFDVWLVGTRGCNEQNQGHINSTSRTPKTSLHDHSDYWYYSMDDIMTKELPRQIDKVLQTTAAPNVTLLGVSFSTQITLTMLGSNKLYASKVHNYVCMEPLMNFIGTNRLWKALNVIIRSLPDDIGTLVFTKLLFSPGVRKALLDITNTRELRYSVGQAINNALFGPSPKYQTLLEDPVFGHILMPTGFRHIKHWSQQVHARRLQKFDYGFLENKRIYGQVIPPIYDISNIHVKNWILVSGSTDVLATQESVRELLEVVHPKPLRHIFNLDYNHVDVFAANDVNIRVNLLLLNFMQNFAYASSTQKVPKKVILENRQLEQFVPLPEHSDGSPANEIK